MVGSLARALVFAVGMLSAAATCALAQELPAPEAPGSHVAHVAALGDAEKESFQRLLSRYDERAERTPDDPVLAVERCRFLAAAGDADAADTLGAYSLLGACDVDLRVRFPHAPQAWLFRAEQHYGVERAALIHMALGEGEVLASSPEGARMRLMLAEQLDQQGEHDQAAQVALSAWNTDPQLDVGLIIARAAKTHGNRGEAVSWLERGLERTDPPHALLAKARLLTELHAFVPAERALQLLEAYMPGEADELLHARILEGLGEIARARAVYRSLEHGFHAGEARRRHFELELARGNQAQALAAYETLRDRGFDNDPLLRQRLRLFYAHPAAPWNPRDAWGLLALLGVIAGIACVPFVLLLPVHYVGLILREQGHDYRSESGITLWQAARLFGIVLATQVFSGYLVAAENLESWFQEHPFSHEPVPLDDTVQARLLVLSMGASLLAILGYLRLPALKQAFAWGRAATQGDDRRPSVARAVTSSIGVLLLIAAGNALLVNLLGIEMIPDRTAVAPVTTQTMLSALLLHYGPFPVIMVAVIFAPLAEELLFRYVLSDALSGYLPWRWANRCQAAVFALCHDQWFMWPTLFCIGLFAGRARRKTSDLTASFLLHAGWNLLVVLAMLSKRLA
ncbi:MAG: CPBP family glutamic-type intramembrane protease [Myxococcales bacterium]